MIPILTRKKLYIIVIGLVILLGIIILLIFLLQNRLSSAPAVPSMTPTPTIHIPDFRTVRQIPTLGPEQNYAVATDSPVIQDSVSSVEALTDSLPYEHSFTALGGIPVDIRIPDQTYADNEWTLLVYIFGPDYMIAETDEYYEVNRRAFLEAAQNVFTFLENQNVDTSTVIIQWGDRAFIQERSEQWLEE